MPSIEEREVYPNAPVVLVALEIRHPPGDPLSPAQRNIIKRRLSQHTPVMRMGRLQQVTLVQAEGSAPVSDVQSQDFPRYFSRDNTLAVSVRSDAVVVETTRYEHWERLRDVAAVILDVRQELGGVDGVERVGLRYIDEIRVPSDSTLDWSEWVDSTLLGPAFVGDDVGLTAIEWQGLAAFSPSADRTIVLRYGPREGFAVSPGGDLKRQTPSPGPFFLIDIDSFWLPSEATPEFESKALLAMCDELHSPVRKLFERFVTERLREEVFRHVE